MDEYIEKKAAKKFMTSNSVVQEYKGVLHNVVPVSILDKFPAADVVEVVRCSECIHQEDCMKQLVFWKRDHVLEQNVYQYHELQFCSYGERRSE